jgi:hypothetical protein
MAGDELVRACVHSVFEHPREDAAHDGRYPGTLRAHDEALRLVDDACTVEQQEAREAGSPGLFGRESG